MSKKQLLTDLMEAYKDEPLPMPVEQWIAERCATALEIAGKQGKTGTDRSGWIQDARYFRITLERLDAMKKSDAFTESIRDGLFSAIGHLEQLGASSEVLSFLRVTANSQRASLETGARRDE